MSVFGTYSRYYDLLYRDKDYAGEAAYVSALIERERPGAKRVLDLGCGTGRHAALLARMGYAVTGVDVSEEMLAVARAELGAFTAEASTAGGKQLVPPKFVRGDVRSVRLGESFDVVVSLFHVLSYQTQNRDLEDALDSVREHLAPGGLFVFDCWYGPAVLSQGPEVRVKRLENAEIDVTRIAEPVLFPNQNLVDVNYQVLVRDKASGRVDELRETHRMRYLFAPEVEALCERCGLRVSTFREFMSDAEPGLASWSVIFMGTLRE